MASPVPNFDERFRQLMGPGASEAIVADLIRQGSAILAPLSDFLGRQSETPALVPLLGLLGKCRDDRAVSLLLRFLESPVPELRRAAANGLGWHRARVALETLDRLEGTDPDERVRHECRAAVEEVLKDFPKLAAFLHHHKPLPPTTPRPGGGAPAPYDDSAPDETQALRLMACLPRLLAVKYSAVPLHFAAGDHLHLAVRLGSERRLVPTLAELTGHHVDLHGWTPERVTSALERLYRLGDDDFCSLAAGLTPVARDEVVELVLQAVRPEEPACPLAEANDAVEAVQVFLSCCGAMALGEVQVAYEPPEMVILGRRRDGTPVRLDPPEPPHRERFLTALRILAGIPSGIGRHPAGRIRCVVNAPPFEAEVTGEKAPEKEVLHLTLHPVR